VLAAGAAVASIFLLTTTAFYLTAVFSAYLEAFAVLFTDERVTLTFISIIGLLTGVIIAYLFPVRLAIPSMFFKDFSNFEAWRGAYLISLASPWRALSNLDDFKARAAGAWGEESFLAN
jgi:hypothetical protein